MNASWPSSLQFKVIQNGVPESVNMTDVYYPPEMNTIEYVFSARPRVLDNQALYLNGEEIPPSEYNKAWISSGDVIELKSIIHK